MEKIDANLLQRLRDLPIEEVAERLGLGVERHKCLCPFHNDTHPSLSFRPAGNTFRCFVCDARGGTIDLVMRLRGLDFREACRWLADRNNIDLEASNGSAHAAPAAPAAHVLPATEECRFEASRYLHFFDRPFISRTAGEFLEQRRIDPRVARWCRLNSWRDSQGIDWLQIPYFDTGGTLIGVQSRRLTPSPAGEGRGGAPRFRFPRGSRCHIYNLPVIPLLKPGEPLYIAEGASDCWALLSSGRKAIAIPSATLLNPQDLQILATLTSQRSTDFHMYPDRDAPGERLFLQLRDALHSLRPSSSPALTHHQLPPDCKDFADAWSRHLIPQNPKSQKQ